MPAPERNSSAPPTILTRVGRALRGLFGGNRGQEPIRDAAALGRFLNTRASFVSQMTLYGYLRTRAGVRFPELFDDDPFVASVNIAKWHVWLACLSDLAVFCGRMVRRSSGAGDTDVGLLMQRLVEEILVATGTPEEAGPEFAGHIERVRARLALCDWNGPAEGDAPFAESPEALVHWAPIVDELKVLDAEIVRNSVRFRWHEIRQQLRKVLDAGQVMAAATAPASAARE